MMKLHRSALMAGLLALGVAACGDDVQVVEPTPPPPPPLAATMAPGAATVAVGNSAVFAINTTGGAAGATASWTCSSSNTGIASVTTTATGCQATGVAIGGVTITAVVTKGDETTNVGAELTVTDDASAVVTINSINQGGVPAISPFAGQLDVVINVERGDQVLEQLDLIVDGTVVASQTFAATAPSADDDDAAEQGIQTITLSFNTAFYTVDPVAGTAAIRHLNGDHGISAQLAVAGATTPVASNTVAVTFLNPNRMHVIASTVPTKDDGTAASAMSAATGLLWWGGPADVTGTTVLAIPLLYNGATIQQVTGQLNDGGVLPFVCTAGTDTTAPFEFNFTSAAASCGAFEAAGVGPAFTAVASGNAVVFGAPVIANTDHPFPVNLDYLGPGVPQFAANPNGRQNGWINAAVGLVGSNTGVTDNDWLINGVADAGVGGYNRWLRVDATAPATVNAAIALDPDPAPALPAPTVNNNDLCFVASASDDLANESTLPVAGTACLTPPFAPFAGVGTGTTHLRGGVDIMAPTIAFDATSLAANSRIFAGTVGTEYVFTVADLGAVGNSGMLSGGPVTARLQTRTAAATTCGGAGLPGATVMGVCTNNTTGLAVALPLVNTTGVAALTAAAYFTIWGQSHDAAGNSSAEISRVVVRDNTVVVATPPAVPVTITGAFLASSFLNDDLSIMDYYWTASYAGGLTLVPNIRLASAPTVVDAFDAATLTNTNFAVNTTVNSYLELQGAPPAAYAPPANAMTGVTLFAADQTQTALSPPHPVAGPGYTSSGAAAVGPTPPATGIPTANAAPAWTFTSYADATTNGVICAGIGTACTATPTSTVVTAVATGTTATFPNPFARVDFYVVDAPFVDLRLIASVPAASATLVDNGATRVWTYSLTVTGSGLYTTMGGVAPTNYNTTIYGFGVNAGGTVAMVSPGVAQTVNAAGP